MAGKLKKAVYLALACLVTAALFYFLARHTTWDEWVRVFSGLGWAPLGGFGAIYLSFMTIKAWRYKVLLRASSHGAAPRFGDLMAVTFAANLFVDLLPARSGSLSYIVFLNRKYGVNLPACVSSFAFSFIFDILGMLPLLVLAVALHALGGGGGWPLMILVAVLALIGACALFLLDKLARFGAAVALWLAARFGQGKLHQSLNWTTRQLLGLESDVIQTKAAGVYWLVLGQSILIRLGKYVGLYILIMGFAAQWPGVAQQLSFPLVLFALLAAEATASLPVSGIAGFGAYEGVMGATLLAAGLSQTQAAMIPFGLHLTTQVIDYTLGGVALLYLSAGKGTKND